MTKEEKLEKMCRDFRSLSEAKQEYILGMLQALKFAGDELRPVMDLVQGMQEGAGKSGTGTC
jgi:predicted GTPase